MGSSYTIRRSGQGSYSRSPCESFRRANLAEAGRFEGGEGRFLLTLPKRVPRIARDEPGTAGLGSLSTGARHKLA